MIVCSCRNIDDKSLMEKELELGMNCSFQWFIQTECKHCQVCVLDMSFEDYQSLIIKTKEKYFKNGD